VLLERGWGKSVQPIAGEDGRPLRVVIRQIVDNIGEPELKVIQPLPKKLAPGELPLDVDVSLSDAKSLASMT
jgi:hypothetical protein